MKKFQIDFTETINNYQDDVYLMAKDIIDRSIEKQKSAIDNYMETQKSVISNFFRNSFANNFPNMNSFIAIPFEQVIKKMEDILDINATYLITSLERSNVFVTGMMDTSKSTNRDQADILIAHLHYNSTQLSDLFNNEMRNAKDDMKEYLLERQRQKILKM